MFAQIKSNTYYQLFVCKNVSGHGNVRILPNASDNLGFTAKNSNTKHGLQCPKEFPGFKDY